MVGFGSLLAILLILIFGRAFCDPSLHQEEQRLFKQVFKRELYGGSG